MSEWNPTANQIYLDALDIQPGDRQRAFIDQACGQDAQLRQEVEELLRAHRESDRPPGRGRHRFQENDAGPSRRG